MELYRRQEEENSRRSRRVMEQKKPCLRCLLEDMDSDSYAAGIISYIKNVPADRRVSEEIYQQRLNACRECDKLINGMCLECGCYVQIRALKPAAECASPRKRWGAVTA